VIEDSSGMRGGCLQFHDSQELDQLAPGWLVDEKSPGGIHAGFPAAFSDHKASASVRFCKVSAKSHQPRVEFGEPLLVGVSGVNRSGAEERIAP